MKNKYSEWSFGEATPSNYKKKGSMDMYPYAMAEKRAKDRVILKLVGLHGYIYSEEESVEFKRDDDMYGANVVTEQKDKRYNIIKDDISKKIVGCKTLNDLQQIWRNIPEGNRSQYTHVKDEMKKRFYDEKIEQISE